jgi:hypothetical protein
MPSLLSTSVAKNYRKQQVPYSRFGSRKIVWFAIGYVDTRTDAYDLDDVKMNTMIDAIQTRGEIVTIGAPRLGDNYGRFTVGIFEDTFNNGNDTKGIDDNDSKSGWNSKSETLQTALREALGDNDVDVEEVYMYGSFNGTSGGWETDNDYREYDTKAEFAQGYLHDDDNPLV